MMWVFGYGSLMWRPGFAFTAQRAAFLPGYDRAFCRLSFRHRGTPQAPGMVLGLTPGAGCRGIAFGVAPEDEGAALAYLDQREGDAYHRVRVPVEMAAVNRESGIDSEAATEKMEAWTYLPDPSHPTHVPGLPVARMVELIATGVGESGAARDYLRELMAQLARLDVDEPRLQEILEWVEQFPANGGRRAV